MRALLETAVSQWVTVLDSACLSERRVRDGDHGSQRMGTRDLMTTSTGVDQNSGDPVATSPLTFPFFVGCGRSGTTLLRVMFDSHPDMAIPHESYFVVSFGRNHRRYERRQGFDLERFLDDLLRHRWFTRWGLGTEEVREGLGRKAPATLADAIRTVFGLYALRQGKLRYGDKTPSYVLNLPLLSRLLPEGRFVHIVRDGRDVALSLLDVDFGPDTIEEAALFWKRHVERGLRAGRALGESRYREVRYEKLVTDPEATLRELCDFLGVDFDDAMLRYHQRAQRVVRDFPRPLEQRHLLQPPTSGLRDWRTQMTASDLARFEALAGDTLEGLGYERSVGRLPIGLLLAARRREAALQAQRAARRARKRLLTRQG